MDGETGLCVLCTLPKLYNDKLANKKKSGFLNWSGAGLMSKYCSILGNFHIHKEVSEASAKYCIGKEQRDEENDTEEQECSAGHGRRIASACCSESPLSP